MALVSMRGVTLAFGGPTLLDRVDWQIERGERVGLVGRNGAGKSTLMRLLHGDLKPDDGEIIRPQGVRIARLPQEVPAGTGRLGLRRGRRRVLMRRRRRVEGRARPRGR